MLKDILTTSQTPEETLHILLYNIGDMFKCQHMAKCRPDCYDGFQAELRLATADALTMLYLYIEQKGWNGNALGADGIERFRERMLEVAKWKK